MNDSPLREKSFRFAVEVVLFYRRLISEKKEFVISKQLLRSGTSIGAQIRESNNAESKADFIHKLEIAQKECDETLYWIELLYATEFISKEEFDKLGGAVSEILKMLKSSILTAKGKKRKIDPFL